MTSYKLSIIIVISLLTPKYTKNSVVAAKRSQLSKHLATHVTEKQ